MLSHTVFCGIDRLGIFPFSYEEKESPMRAYWWQNGLHIEPESEEDYPRIHALMEIFETVQTGHKESLNTQPIVTGSDQTPSNSLGVS